LILFSHIGLVISSGSPSEFGIKIHMQ
jgi:hypothetical protein